MKLICSILILAGVFALNNASILNEAKRRLVSDRLKLEDLKRMATNRDVNSVECSQKMMSGLSDVMATFNADMDACNNTRQAEIERLNQEAKKTVEEYGVNLKAVCEALNECSLLDLPGDSLICYKDKTSAGSSVLTGVAADAATKSAQLQKGIENADGKKDICEKMAYRSYSTKSDKLQTEFDDCVNGRTTIGGDTTTPPTTEQPQEPTEEPTQEPTQEPAEGGEDSTPSGEGGEVEQPEGRGRRPNGANKHKRF